ncbi:PKD domain-containing protein [Chitinophagaceae bacterium LWZ2-11]
MQKTIVLFLTLSLSFLSQAQDVSFSYTASGICAPISVTFIDNTPGTIINRIWDFGDGLGFAFSTSLIPLIQTGRNYSDAGDYTVTLTVEFEDHSRKSISHVVNVRPAPIANFTASTYAGCPNLLAGFTDASTTSQGTITQWLWDLGADTSTQQNPTFTYTNTGLNNVSLIVYNNYGCKGSSAAQQINVYNNAASSFTIDKTKDCTSPSIFSFTNTTTGQGNKNYTWNFGDGSGPDNTESPTHNYTAAGQYNVSLNVINGTNCSNTTYPQTIYVGTPQSGGITMLDEGCVNTSISFSTTVIPSSFTNNTYKWTFSDGSIYYGQSNSKTFATPGTYTVTLIITNGGGCVSNPVTKTITVKPSPTASFTVDKTVLCAEPYTANFTNTGPTGSNYSYSWNFGDGVTDVSENPQHTYATGATGWRTVTLKTTDNNAECSGTQSFNYMKIGLPQVTLLNVTPNAGCKALTVKATASTSNINDAVQSYTWNFGDGVVTTTIPSASFTYTTAGSKSVSITITTTSGCTATSNSLPVTVTETCTDDGTGGGAGGGGGFAFAAGSCSNKFAVTFTDTLSQNPANNTIVTSWNFGDAVDNTNPGLTTITHTYPSTTGTTAYTVTVTRQNTNTGVVTTYTKNIVIINETANFTVSKTSECTQKNISFTALGLNTQYITNVKWDFGDGSNPKIITAGLPGTGINVNTSTGYRLPGNYTPTFTITDKNGCTSSKALSLPIAIGGPTANFSVTDLTSCKEQKFTKPFTDASIPLNANTPIVKWDWYAGVTLPSTPTISYDNNNIPNDISLSFTNNTGFYQDYNVKLIVTDVNGCVSAPKTFQNFIKSYWPKAVINTSSVVTCNNYQFYFSNGSTGKNLKYNWDFGDGTAHSNMSSLYHTYAQDGSYNTTLIAIENALPTCADTAVKLNLIQIIKPTASFTVSSLAECAPVAVNFTNTSAYANSSSWNFGDGGVGSILPNPSGHIYNAGGDYTITLTVTGPNGCTNTKDSIIHIKGPNGSFTYGDITGCNPFTFTGQVSGTNVNAFAWDFRDGTLVNTPSTTNTLTHAYTQAGIYKPNIILSSTDGCTYKLEMQPDDKVIVDEIYAAFNINQNTFCKEGNVSFTNISTVADFSSFKNYLWTFGDGLTDNTTNPGTHLYNSSGTYNATLSVESQYGCTALTENIAIIVHPEPKPNIAGDDVVCLLPQGPQLQYSNTGTSEDAITSYEWKIDGTTVGTDANLSLDYRIPGNHTVSLTVTTINGCDSTVTKNIIVDSVRAGFTVDQTKFCGKGNPVFTNTSTAASTPSITNYLWSFGDGNTSNNADAGTYRYTVPGTYNVTLFAESQNGCTQTTDPVSITVNPMPSATITGDNVVCLLVQGPLLNYASTVNSLDAIKAYEWKIDGTAVGTEVDLSLDYRIPGNHTVSLTVTTINGCDSTDTKNIIVDSVRASFTVDQTKFCGKGSPIFTNTSTVAPTSDITNYLWSFGDDNTSNSADVNTYQYANSGVYNVTLFAESQNGCTQTTDPVSITVNTISSAAITGDNVVCLLAQGPLLNYASIINSVDDIKAYEWKIDGATVGTDASLSLDYRIPGNHTVSLTVTTINGCDSTVTKNIIIDSVRASFTVDQTKFCGIGNPVFMNTSTVAPTSSITNYLWNLGDGNTSNNVNAGIYHYADPGTYNITLSAESQNGCTQTTDPVSITVNTISSAAITGDNVVCLLVQGPLLNYASNVNSVDAIKAYEWKIDGTTVGTDASLSLDYRIPGNHTVSLTVTTINGCDSTVTKNIIIDSVRASFTVDQTKFCGIGNPVFTNTSIVAPTSSITNYLWNFGDGNTSSQENPRNTYNNAGTYNVSLHIQSSAGCTADTLLAQAITIYTKPQLSIMGAGEICLHKEAVFSANAVSTDNVISYTWMINDSLVPGSDMAMHAMFDIAADYNIKYNIATQFGCTDSGEVSLTVHPVPLIQITSDTTICKGENLQLIASGGVSYAWSGNDIIGSATDAITTVSPVVDTKYRVTVTNNFGCVNIADIEVKVNIPVALTVSDDAIICSGSPQKLWAAGNTSTFIWLPETGLNNPNIANPIATPHTTTTYLVRGVSNNVCADDLAQITVTVSPTPTINIGNDTTVVAGTQINLYANGSDNIVKYLWLPVTGLSCTDCPDPIFTANNDITYTLSVTTEDQCTAEQSLTVHVLCNQGSVYIPSAFTPNSDGKNDVFYVMGSGVKLIKSFKIYNRFGNLVFIKENISANDRTKGWDGTVKGQPVNESGTFVYVVEAICSEGTPIFLKGTVVLIK